MAKLLTNAEYKYKVFLASKGKVITKQKYRAHKPLIKVQCMVCKHKFKVASKFTVANKKALNCPECKKPKLATYDEQQKILADYLSATLKFTDSQIAQLFEIKKPEVKRLLGKTKGFLFYKGKDLTVISCDPGTSNFSIFVGKMIGKETLKYVEPIESRMLINTFSNINNGDMYSKFAAFLNEIDQLIITHQPHILIMERFQSRGGYSSNSNEIVNIMLGLLLNWYISRYQILVRITPPAAWKRRVAMVFNLKAEYKKITKIMMPHQLDAALIALSLYPDKKNPYTWLKDEKVRLKWYKAITDVCWQMH